MFKRQQAVETIKTLIVQDTWIEGTPVYAGEVVEIDKETLTLLREVKRAVEYDRATKDQLKLEKTRKEPVHAA